MVSHTTPSNNIARSPRGAARTAAVALALMTTGAMADINDIAWDSNGRFERSVNVASGKFAELCGRLPKDAKVRWNFEASVPLDFNVHHHVGKEVTFASKLVAVNAAKDTLDAKTEQEYCWMWSNKSAAQATVIVTLQR